MSFKDISYLDFCSAGWIHLSIKGVVLLRCEISLKVICENVKFSNCDFCNNWRDYEWTYICTYKLFKNIFNDFLTEVKGEINMA